MSIVKDTTSPSVDPVLVPPGVHGSDRLLFVDIPQEPQASLHAAASARAAGSRDFAIPAGLLCEGRVRVELHRSRESAEQRSGFSNAPAPADCLAQINPACAARDCSGSRSSIAAPTVNDDELADLSCEGRGDVVMRRQVLVTNPAALYWN